MADMAKDPVCGKEVDARTSPHERMNEIDYCFCSDDCRHKFVVNPGRYLAR